MKTLVLVFLTSLSVMAEDNRFIKSFHVSTNLCLVISEGEKEWRSQGSYTIRLHDWVDDKKLPAGAFYSGLVRPRDGTLENVFFIDVDGDGKKDVIVTIRVVGTGAYLSADAFKIQGQELTFLAHVQDLLPTANVVTALKKQIAAKH
jgi:Periplasmic lysozyme inhibitor of I-type lysozyme